MDKTGYVSVLGRPNVGKSTLLNRILGEKLSIISDKAQTTRNKIQLIYSDEETQIIFLDTPGIQSPRNKLGEYMEVESKSALGDSDLVLYIVDTSDFLGSKEKSILDMLADVDQKVILAINKIDTIEKPKILEIIDLYKEYDFIDEIIPISAATGENVDVLMEMIKKHLPEGPRYYPDDQITDKSERFIVSEIIREKALNYLHQEVPHGINVGIEVMKDEGDFFDIIATIFVERESHKGIVIGKGGTMIKRIRKDSEKDIEKFLDKDIKLELWVKVEKNWRDKESKVKQFGYR